MSSRIVLAQVSRRASCECPSITFMNDAWVNFAFGDGPGENEDDDDDRVGMATPAASSDHMSEAA